MWNVLMVAVGGAAGSVLRYAAGLLSLRLFGPVFPAGTLAVNCIGCFLLAWLSLASVRTLPISQELRLLLTTGVCGGFTTYSTFNVEVWRYGERAQYGSALLYVLLTLCGGWAAAGLAVWWSK